MGPSASGTLTTVLQVYPLALTSRAPTSQNVTLAKDSFLALLFGGGGGYYAYGPTGERGIGGVVLIILAVLLLTGRL